MSIRSKLKTIVCVCVYKASGKTTNKLGWRPEGHITDTGNMRIVDRWTRAEDREEGRPGSRTDCSATGNGNVNYARKWRAVLWSTLIAPECNRQLTWTVAIKLKDNSVQCSCIVQWYGLRDLIERGMQTEKNFTFVQTSVVADTLAEWPN